MEIRRKKLRIPRPLFSGDPGLPAVAAVSALLLGMLVCASFFAAGAFSSPAPEDSTDTTAVLTLTAPQSVYSETDPPEQTSDPEPEYPWMPVSASPVLMSTEVGSPYAVLVDAGTMFTVAEKNADDRMYPASMTKIMTLILVCEMCPGFEGYFTVTQNIVDEVAAGSGSNVGLAAGETVSMRDLVYSMMLPSACDSAKCIACFIAGSEDEFSVLMNEKAKELGMTGTHFSGASGMHSPDNYSTARDVAAMLAYAFGIEEARKVMSTSVYTMSATDKHPARKIRSTVFRLEETYTGERKMEGDIVCGKTGTASAAGKCLASVAVTEDGRIYILVTGGASSSRLLMDDTYYIYSAVCG